jgi:hypothetical protein
LKGITKTSVPAHLTGVGIQLTRLLITGKHCGDASENSKAVSVNARTASELSSALNLEDAATI